jgi:uncharacterized NAD-dependent epimerase/dehydratase family protein
MSRKLIILTEGHSDPHTAKTACSIIRYRPEEVVAVLDSTNVGKTTAEPLGVGETRIVAQLADAPEANTLLIGIAPPGGKIPEPWRRVVLEAIDRGMNVVSGLHDFIGDDDEFARAADAKGVSLIDVRKNSEKTIARRTGIRNDCLRLLTVGHDCSIGKMVTSIEIAAGLKDRDIAAKFVATGQTGIMVEGDGLPIDCVVADFVSGAVERMVLEQQHHDVLVFEGQGSLVHPSYSAVTLGLLHGCLPHALVLCYEVLRDRVTGIDHMEIPDLTTIRHLNETMASIVFPCPVIAISMNSRRVDAAEAEQERRRMQDQFELPVVDVFRHGRDELVDAITQFRDESDWSSFDPNPAN